MLIEQARKNSFVVVKIERFVDYVEMQIVSERDGYQRGVFRYLVRRGDRYQLQYPFLIFARDWPVTVSEHFAVHCREPYEVLIPDSMINMGDLEAPDTAVLERFYDLVTRVTGAVHPERIHYYRCESQFEVEKLLGQKQPFRGPCIVDFRRHAFEPIARRIVTVSEQPILGLRAGLASYGELLRWEWGEMTPGQINELNNTTAYCLEYLGEHPIHFAFFGPNTEQSEAMGYCMVHVLGVFAKYLIDTHGTDKFRSLYQRSRTEAQFLNQCQEVYAIDLDSIEHRIVEQYGTYTQKHQSGVKGAQ